jgi:hypothetical protein
MPVPESLKARRPLWRGVAVLVAGAVAVGALAVTPALAGKFLTKKRGDKLFLGNTTEATVTQTVPTGTGATITVNCPPGQQATDGGADSPALFDGSGTEAMVVAESAPVVSGGRSVGWTTEVVNLGANTLTITGHAVCVP